MTQITRSPEIIGAEIRFYVNEAKRMTLVYGAEIGKRLIEAKESVPHGEWGDFLTKETEFSQSAANRFMRLYNEYGASGLLDSNSPSLTNLNISSALALLAVPAEEREAVAEEVKADTLSTSELTAALKERDELKRQLAEAEEGHALTMAELEEAKQNAEEKLIQTAHERDNLKLTVKELESRPRDVAVEQPDPDELQAAIDEAVAKAKKDAEAATASAIEAERAKAAKESSELAEKLVKAEKAAENAKKMAEAAKNTVAVDKLKADAETAKEEVERLKKQLAMSDTNMTVFKLHFDAVQKDFEDCMAMREKLTDEQKVKASAALTALVAKLGERI